MNSTVEKIQKLMEENNEKPTPLMKKLGLASSSFSDWKRDKASPSTEAIIKIAKYFHVSTDYLLLEDKIIPDVIYSEDDKHVLKLYSSLSDLDKRECIGFMKGLLHSSLHKNQ